MNKTVSLSIAECRLAFEKADFDTVLSITQELVKAHPDRHEVWRVRAEAYVGSGNSAEALSSYVHAIALAPSDSELRVRFARALAHCGFHRIARTEFETAFKLNPTSLAALHGVVGYRRLDPDDPVLEGVKLLCEQEHKPTSARVFSCFLLGRIFSCFGRDADAFSYYQTANDLSRVKLAQEPIMRGPRDFVDWWMKGAPLTNVPMPGTPVNVPQKCPALLISGLPRSGKSLVEHLLASHPAIAAGQELGGLHGIVEAQNGTPRDRLEALFTSKQDHLAECYSQALASCRNSNAHFITDTSPANLWDLGYMGNLHPKVPIILCKRNALDLGSSIYFKKFKHGHAYSYDQAALGGMLAKTEMAIKHWCWKLPNPIQVLDYETLVTQPEWVRDMLLRWLGLDPSACGPLQRVSQEVTEGLSVHTSHSTPGYGPIVSDLIGIGSRFSIEFTPMMTAYRQSLDEQIN